MGERAEDEVRRLAERIARDLFTDGSGRTAKRLVHEHEGERIDGGGWSERAVADRIEDALRSEADHAG